MIGTLNRDHLWMVQTPQTFYYDLIHKAHRAAEKDDFRGTDDAALVERLGHPVRVLQGSYENIKVTTPQELKLAEEILLQRRKERP
jgi:2-C-methyl-D-erythritol 4-phosphate cytidylyltransferase